MIVPVSGFINGREQQAELYEEAANILSVIRTKVSLRIHNTLLAIITLLTGENKRSKPSTKTPKK